MTKRKRYTNAWPSSAAGSAEDKKVCRPWRQADSDTDSDSWSRKDQNQTLSWKICMAIRFEKCGKRPTVGSIASYLEVHVESVIQAIKHSRRLSTGDTYFCPEVADRLEDWKVTTIPRSNPRRPPVVHHPRSQAASSVEKMPDEKNIPRKKGTSFIGKCGDETQAAAKKEKSAEAKEAAKKEREKVMICERRNNMYFSFAHFVSSKSVYSSKLDQYQIIHLNIFKITF